MSSRNSFERNFFQVVLSSPTKPLIGISVGPGVDAPTTVIFWMLGKVLSRHNVIPLTFPISTRSGEPSIVQSTDIAYQRYF